MSINLAEHINQAEIILVESHRQFSRLITEVNQLKTFHKFDLSPEAVIYQYQLESGEDKANSVNQELFAHAQLGKKILVLSDEGSSVFLEPMNMFKSVLVTNNIQFQVLPGPNSVISAVVSGRKSFNEFYFAGNLQWIPSKRKEEIFNHLKILKPPTVFILRSIGLEGYVKELYENLGNDWYADLGINLTMETENHIEGPLNKIITFVENNFSMWQQEKEDQKIIITLYPKEK